jgi:spermidine/putrescine transport system permease protein
VSSRIPGDRTADLIYSAPALVVLFALTIAPLLIIAGYSVLDIAPDGTMRGFTLANYRRTFDPVYLSVFAYSARHALLTTIASLLLAYPCALALRSFSPRWRTIALGMIIVPSWLNLLVKNYAWIVLLRREGVVNTILQALSLIDTPLRLLFNDKIVLLALIHTYVPFMILPLYAAVDRMDWSLVEAARDLGARPWQQFRHVILPQTRVGAAVGIALVFIPTLGAYVTAELLGGAGNMMVANLIENQVVQVRNWPLASALSMLLVVIVLVTVTLLNRMNGAREQLL